MVKLRFSKRLLFLIVFIFGISLSAIFVLSVQYFTYTLTTPINGTIYNTTAITVNMTLNSTALSGMCNYTIGLTNQSYAVGNTTGGMTNTSNIWTNTNYLGDSNISDSTFTLWNNLTFYCPYSASVKDKSPNYYFKVDSLNPSVSFTPYNYTQSAVSTLNFTFSFIDNNTYSCGIRYFPDVNTSNIQYIYGTILNNSASTNCTVTLDSTKLNNILNGELTFRGYGNDSVGRTALSGTSITLTAIKLYANKWNLITFKGFQNLTNDNNSNETATRFVTNHSSYVTQLSIWNLTSNKFITYSSSTPSINNFTLYPGVAVYLYSTADTWFFEQNKTPAIANINENITIHLNDSYSNSSWSLMGLFKNVTMNTTLFACSWNGTTASGVLRAELCAAGQQNISYISWYNSSGSQYVTCKRGFSICSGGLNPTQLILPSGSAVWILPANNITLNRSAIY